jgi:apolipoprotein N-acyltransferase
MILIYFDATNFIGHGNSPLSLCFLLLGGWYFVLFLLLFVCCLLFARCWQRAKKWKALPLIKD